MNDNDADGGMLGVLQRHARAGHQRSLGVQAVGRRLFAGPAAAADRRDSSPGTTYPAYQNTGTTQPKFDGRIDYDFEDGRKLSFRRRRRNRGDHTPASARSTSTRAEDGPRKISYTQKGLHANFFTNVLDGNASNLLTRDVNFRPIGFDFQTETYDAELTNVDRSAASRAQPTAGNFRYNSFDLSLAPQADNRVEFGVYGQDEIFLSNHFRVVGARIDRFDYLDDFVFSPRTTFMVKPSENQQFRRVLQPLTLAVGHQQFPRRHRRRAGQPRRVQPRARRPHLPAADPSGNADLQEEKMDAFEVGYTGSSATARRSRRRSTSTRRRTTSSSPS